MKTKIIPFDLEMAKKIQAGEIKGRIINSIGTLVEIVSFNVTNTPTSIVGIVHYLQADSVIYIRKNGTCFNSIHDLIIELPEEAPEEQHSIEECELYKVGYKVGFEAGRCVVFDEKKGCAIKKETPKHEFKPFDKVLVRHYDVSLWQPAFFWKFFDELSKTPYYTIDGNKWEQCIPYEGNEHLVGTTDKQKEE